MGYEVACSCGKFLPVSEGMAGASISCDCGRMFPVPPLSELRVQAVVDAAPLPALDSCPAGDVPPGPAPLAEIIPPTQVFLRTKRGDRPDRRVRVMAALTPEAIWIQDTWQVRCLRLQDLGIERPRNGKE